MMRSDFVVQTGEKKRAVKKWTKDTGQGVGRDRQKQQTNMRAQPVVASQARFRKWSDRYRSNILGISEIKGGNEMQ
jgi:hypothetical protein